MKFSKIGAAEIITTIAFLAAVVLVIAMWREWAGRGPEISEWFLSSSLLAGEKPDRFARSGQWGDGFGSLNALFAGLALCSAVGAFFMQGQTLREQRIDNHVARFESTYFELIALLKQARSEVRYRASADWREITPSKYKLLAADTQTGGAAFRLAIYEFRYLLRQTKIVDRDSIGRLYTVKVHNRHESTFGPYFRLIYTILRTIRDDDTLSRSQKIKYGNLLRSQLTSFEIALAAFNAMMPEANDLDQLLTEFRMLKYLPNGRTRRLLQGIYKDIAFEGRDDRRFVVSEFLIASAVIFGTGAGAVLGLLAVIAFGLAAGGPTAVVLVLIGASLGSSYALDPKRNELR
ncbi:putative phage abortive infection protein [Rhizobium sp. BE258]|uniref:putative phage abortive infection protein n=1 Tax=Rhizobium sp. BE258 TaxID=2817722 RepID=UPI00285DA051|nr:putative phage abortive infection protein [Rhizobium sp. BE258]MDR7148043.1 hypothetical protein [Rhizobium sp. BE258]